MAVRLLPYEQQTAASGEMQSQRVPVDTSAGAGMAAVGGALQGAGRLVEQIDDDSARAEAAKAINQKEIDDAADLQQQSQAAIANPNGFGERYLGSYDKRTEKWLSGFGGRTRHYLDRMVPQLRQKYGTTAIDWEFGAKRARTAADLGTAYDNVMAGVAQGSIDADEARKRAKIITDQYASSGAADPGVLAKMQTGVDQDISWYSLSGQLQHDPATAARRLGVAPDADAFRSNANARVIWDRLLPVLGPVGTAGLMSALSTEAPGFDPSAVNPVSGATGIAQWLGDRKTTLQARGNSQTIGVQLEHLVSELQTSESKWAERLRNAKTLDEAVDAAAGFERNEGWSEGNPRGSVTWEQSRRNADSIAAAFGGGAPIDPALIKDLSPDQLLALRSKAETEVKQQQAQRRAALVPVVENHEAAFDIGDTVQNPLTRGDFIDALGPVQGPQAFSEYDAKRDIGMATATLRTMPAAQIAETVAGMRPTDPNASDYAVRLKGWSDASAAANRIAEARAQDPAGFVQNTFPAVRQAWAGVDVNDPAALDAAAGLTLATQAQIGIAGSAAHALPDRIRAQLVQQVQGTAPRARAEFFRSLNTPSGAAVLRDLTTGEHALSPLNTVLASLGGDPVAQTVLAKALAAEEEDKGSGRKSVGEAANGADGLDARVDADMEPVRRVLNASGAPQSTVASLMDAAKLMSYQLYSGDTAAASKRAVEMLTADNDVVDEPGSMLALVPKGLGERAQELGERMKGRGLRAPATDIDALRREALTLNDLQLLAPSVPGESDDARASATWNRFLAGTFVQASDGSGLVLVDPNGSFIFKRDGTPVALSFDTIRTAQPDTTVHVPGRAVPPTVATPRADAATQFVPTPENTGVPADVLQENERRRQEQRRKLQDGE
ncbi:hypothetical protein QFZ27_004666 [Inquilinus ginsengisoli]|uniref:phage tail tip lysozyme n=1 Tax=Inquilinus ginsengisoli TaxID=363840 RepID=UPI003D195C31